MLSVGLLMCMTLQNTMVPFVHFVFVHLVFLKTQWFTLYDFKNTMVPFVHLVLLCSLH